ncbi:hypothetical protein CMUS01_14592 [Colletotrichum musicola]|uniref:Uncharacterized protein n=1 Tax=Colletotrichum musicola TaxID=2175873 RepID=A0A8H6J3Y4_9PEZI|nr:hypothetical protein CMUS01_14592 [Colletotrichum musicola]
MHPVTGEILELLRSTADARRRREQGGERSGMPILLARKLALYITGIFQTTGLLSEGYELAFHAYDYGANIEIKTSPELYELPRERHCTTEEDDEGDDDDDDDDDDDTDDEGGNPNRWDGDGNETLQLAELSLTDEGPAQATVGAGGSTGADGRGNDARYGRLLRESNDL